MIDPRFVTHMNLCYSNELGHDILSLRCNNQLLYYLPPYLCAEREIWLCSPYYSLFVVIRTLIRVSCLYKPLFKDFLANSFWIIFPLCLVHTLCEARQKWTSYERSFMQFYMHWKWGSIIWLSRSSSCILTMMLWIVSERLETHH